MGKEIIWGELKVGHTFIEGLIWGDLEWEMSWLPFCDIEVQTYISTYKIAFANLSLWPPCRLFSPSPCILATALPKH